MTDKDENLRGDFAKWSILRFIPLFFGMGISYLVKGALDLWILIPCVILGQLLLWFLISKRQPVEK